MKNKKYALNAILILSFIFLLEIFRDYKIENRNNEAKNFDIETVGKAYKYTKGRHSDLIYYFYHNNKKYFDSLDEHNFKYQIGKLYIVKYSLNDPQNSHIILEKEIRDSIYISKKGFKPIKHNYYDYNTNVYKYKLNWE